MRFRKSIKLAPGIRMNLSGSGLSWTLGPRGASIGIGKRGTYLNSGIPGTGLYNRQRISPPAQKRSSAGTTRFSATVSVSDDGQVTFKDEAGNPLSDSRIATLKEQKGDVLHELIQRKCDEINGQIEALGEIHLHTPRPDEKPRFDPGSFNLQQPWPPIPKSPGLLGWLFPWFAKRVAEKNAAAQEEFQARFDEWQAHKAEFEAAEAARRQLVANVLAGDASAMEEFFGSLIEDIVWPQETNVSFEVTPSGERIALSVDLPEVDDMPTRMASIPQRGFKLSVKDMGPTWVQKLYMRHVHGIGFRIIGEAFAGLPTVREVVLSAYSQRPSRSTGQVGDEYLYSVRASRTAWEEINFANLEAIDVVEAFSRFELRRSMTKTGIFKPVEPLNVSDVTSSSPV